MSLYVGDIVYQRPETIRGGLPRTLNLGPSKAWEVLEVRDDGYVVLGTPGEIAYLAPSGTLVNPIRAYARVEVLILAEERLAQELMA